MRKTEYIELSHENKFIIFLYELQDVNFQTDDRINISKLLDSVEAEHNFFMEYLRYLYIPLLY